MIQVCKSSPKKDVGKVIPGLFPDIEELIENHKVSDTSAKVAYNNLADIEQVGFRINDDFDAIVLSRALKSGLQPNSGHGSSQQAGSSAPVGAPSTGSTGSESGS